MGREPHADTVRGRGLTRALLGLAPVLLLSCSEPADGVAPPRPQPDCSEPEGADGPRPNVVVIALESLRARSVTPYAPELDTTPFFDRLADEGALAERAYAVIPHTTKGVVPMFCGFYPKIAKATVEGDPAGLPSVCLAEHLAQQDYATYFIQSATKTWEQREQLVANMGFRAFDSKESLPTEGFHESSYFGFEDDVMLEPALQWIDEQTCPFFLGVLTLTSHHDYTIPNGFPITEWAEDEALNNYLNTVAYTDRFAEQLFAGLEERGLADNTIFVVAGDHGEGFGEHGRTQHDNVIWEEGLHVPMILRGPGIEPGTRIEGLRQIQDIPPTLLRMLGLEAPTGLDGLDLFTSSGHERVFASCWHDERCMAMVEGDQKVIYHYEDRDEEVFSLDEDPLEQNNLVDEGENRAYADAAVELMLQWRDTVNARYEALGAHSGSEE